MASMIIIRRQNGLLHWKPSRRRQVPENEKMERPSHQKPHRCSKGSSGRSNVVIVCMGRGPGKGLGTWAALFSLAGRVKLVWTLPHFNWICHTLKNLIYKVSELSAFWKHEFNEIAVLSKPYNFWNIFEQNQTSYRLQSS